jgi:hypothetical protein
MPFTTTTITNSNTTLATVSQGQRWKMTALTLCNFSGSAETVTVYVVPSGSAAANGNTVIKSLSIPSADTYVFDSPLQLNAGDFIVGIGSTGSAVAAQVHYEVQL